MILMAVMIQVCTDLMGDLCNQTSTLSNTAEIVESELSYRLSPLQWSKLGRQSVLTSHSAGGFKNL